MEPDTRRYEAEANVPSDLDPKPLEYRPVPPSVHTYRMVDGVMQVFSDESQAEAVFQVRGKGRWGGGVGGGRASRGGGERRGEQAQGEGLLRP